MCTTFFNIQCELKKLSFPLKLSVPYRSERRRSTVAKVTAISKTMFTAAEKEGGPADDDGSDDEDGSGGGGGDDTFDGEEPVRGDAPFTASLHFRYFPFVLGDFALARGLGCVCLCVRRADRCLGI